MVADFGLPKSRIKRLRSLTFKLDFPVTGGIASYLFTFILITSSVQAQIVPPLTWEEFDTQAQALAPVVSVLAAEVTDGTCKEVHNFKGNLTTPIGSGFKLYVLAEVAAQIGQRGYQKTGVLIGKHHSLIESENKSGSLGRSRWEMPLRIRPKYKSIPGGPLLYVPDGSIFTLRYFAEQMIQRSDNTATDHLLFFAGRKNVERRMALTGHHDPSLNIPLFATREFAVLKFLWSDEQLEAYEQASVAKRRQLLAAEKRGWPALEAFFEQNGDQTEPERVETVEWFANRFDICNLMISIQEMGQKPILRPLLEVLTLADPIGFDREDWIYVGFKGGSEIGVQAGNWLVQRNDGRLFFFSAAFIDPNQALDLANIIPLLERAPDILFATP